MLVREKHVRCKTWCLHYCFPDIEIQCINIFPPHPIKITDSSFNIVQRVEMGLD